MDCSLQPAGDCATILLVDRDEVLGQVLGRVLKGRRIIQARNATDGSRLAEQETPQLALVNRHLPDGDGIDLAKKLRTCRARLSVILLAAQPLPLRENPELADLFAAVLVKPMDLDELRRAVDAALRAASAAATPQSSGAAVLPVRVEPKDNPPRAEAQLPPLPKLENRMGIPQNSRLKPAALIGVAVILLIGLVAVIMGAVPWLSASHADPVPANKPPLGVELVPDRPHTLAIPEEVRKALGIRKGQTEMAAVAKAPTQTQTMVLPGSTSLDPTRLWRIRIRFSGRLEQIGRTKDEAASREAGETRFRELRCGDPVYKKDPDTGRPTLLGVFYSADVGNIKNNLVDAISQYKLDKEILERSEAAYLKGAIPEVFLLNAKRNVEADQNAINRAAANLRAWDIPEADIQACYKEADEIRKRGGKRDPEVEKLWPRVELFAPEDGIIVERNVAEHEMVVDNTTNLFQIAKVDRLLVLANVPEDDLPTLQALETKDRKWNVRTVGAAPAKGIDGPIDEIGYLIDPNQHTAIIKGHINNPGNRIRAGQFVSATVQIPPPNGVVEVPIDAVAEDGQMCVVFVQTDPDKHEYTMRRVQLIQRFDKTAFVRSEPFKKEEQLTPEEAELGMLPKERLNPGERVLTTGVGELKAALLDLESKPKKDKKD
jgi:cobalt-zinc-cadmium efflux system membrane fusion protein